MLCCMASTLTQNMLLQAEVALVQPAVAERVVLQGLTIQLGPDLRTTYPVVMNFNISGQVDITGPADANKLQLQGTVKLDSGEVTLLGCWIVLFVRVLTSICPCILSRIAPFHASVSHRSMHPSIHSSILHPFIYCIVRSVTPSFIQSRLHPFI